MGSRTARRGALTAQLRRGADRRAIDSPVLRIAAAAVATGVAVGLASPLRAAPPTAGVLVPGQTLARVAVGATETQVREAWGERFGRCRSCPHRTWYFNLRPFEPRGIGVEFRRGRVAAVFTLWQPEAWRSSRGLRLGDPAAGVRALHGPVERTRCRGYRALTRRDGGVTTVFYVVDDKVWGFALVGPGVDVCR